MTLNVKTLALFFMVIINLLLIHIGSVNSYCFEEFT